MSHDMLKKERIKFRKLFLQWLQQNGGVKNAAYLVGMYEWQIETRAGILLLNFHEDDDSIFGRFMHPEEAAELLTDKQSLNMYSGKWNHHYDRSCTAESAMEDFMLLFQYVQL
jgi:hypothetical protein